MARFPEEVAALLSRATRITLTMDWAPLFAVVDGHGDFLSPFDLPISRRLQAELADWGERFDYQARGATRRAYELEGWGLAKRLARELDDRPPVYWYDTPAMDGPAPHGP